MDVALSPTGRWVMRVFFALVIVFLYAPIAILLVFSFNSSPIPVFPLTGFTLRWYHDFLTNGDMQVGPRDERDHRGACRASAPSRSGSSRRSPSRAVVSAARLGVTALLLSPLVIPLLVLGVSMALLFHELGMQRSIYTVMIGHVVVTVPYTILVIRPRLEQIDASLGEAAYDLGAGPFTHVPPSDAAAHPAGRRLRVPDRLHDLVRRVRGRLVPRRAAADVSGLPVRGAALPAASCRR